MVVIKKSNSMIEQNTVHHHSNEIKNNLSSGHATASNGITNHPISEENENKIENKEYLSNTEKWSANLVERGKDLLSSETSSAATAAAIIVSAALIEIELIPGLIIGASAILLGKIFPEIGSYIRPAVKGVVRAGFSATHRVRQIIAEASEQVSDLVAEVHEEQKLSTSNEHSLIAKELIKSETATH